MKKIILTLSLLSLGFGACVAQDSGKSLLNKVTDVSGVSPKQLSRQVVEQFESFLNNKEFAAILVENLEISVKTYETLEKYEVQTADVPPAKKTTYDATITDAMKNVIISAAAPFLKALYVGKKILIPMLSESLGSSKEQSFLYRFLSPEIMQDNFLESSIKEKADVKNLCIEFARVFGDLASTFPVAFQAGQQHLEQIRKTK